MAKQASTLSFILSYTSNSKEENEVFFLKLNTYKKSDNKTQSKYLLLYEKNQIGLSSLEEIKDRGIDFSWGQEKF